MVGDSGLQDAMAQSGASKQRDQEIENVIRSIIFEARVFKNKRNGVAWSRSVNDLIRTYVPKLRDTVR